MPPGTLKWKHPTNPSGETRVKIMVRFRQPDQVVWRGGSEAEEDLPTKPAVARRILIKPNQGKLPGCYYHRSNANDFARVEQCLYVHLHADAGGGRAVETTAPKPSKCRPAGHRMRRILGSKARPIVRRKNLTVCKASTAAGGASCWQDELFMNIHSHLPNEIMFQRELLIVRRRAF